MDSCAADSTIVKSWREQPPSSYSIKINNLSQLNLDKYESRRFLSGGYNWRLVIYPKGNEKDNGKGFISMYVEIDNTSFSSTTTTEVFAYLMFFIYNKKQNKYFTIQDVEVKRFNALRREWGLSQVLTLEIFNDHENGYIFEDEQCEFGADVMVAPPFTKWEIVSFNKELTYPNFSWSVKDFSVLKENFYVSDSFSMGGRKWALKLYPKGDSRAYGKWLSIFLQLADSETLLDDEKIYVRANLQVLDHRGSNHVKTTCMPLKLFIVLFRNFLFLALMGSKFLVAGGVFNRRYELMELNSWYTESNKTWGFIEFLSLAKLRDSYLDPEDTLDIEIEFEVVSATKCSQTI